MFLDDLINDANNDDKFESKDEWIIPGPILNGKCSVSADQGDDHENALDRKMIKRKMPMI